MFFWSVFLKTRQKVIDHQKRHFGPFWQLIMLLFCVFKNTVLNNICASIVFKAKTKEKFQEKFFCTVFISKLKNALFGGRPIFFKFFFYQSQLLKQQTYKRPCQIQSKNINIWAFGQFTCSGRSKLISTLHPSKQ